jgi:hypothetical protein
MEWGDGDMQSYGRFLLRVLNDDGGGGLWSQCSSTDQNALSPLRFECKRETMAENNMVLKYLQKVSLDKYLMIVEIEFYSLAVLKL